MPNTTKPLCINIHQKQELLAAAPRQAAVGPQQDRRQHLPAGALLFLQTASPL
jgi:hypothetical protein